MSHAVFPDAEAIAVSILVDAEIPVASALPSNPSFPLVVVKRIGGVPIEKHHADNPSIQVDVWGTSKAEAHDLAQQTRAALHEAEGSLFESFSAFITGVEDTLGLSWLPDPVTQRARYVFGVGMYLTTVPNGN